MKTPRLVSTVVDEVKSPGLYTADLDGGSLKSGIYVCRIVMGSKVQTKKMTLIK